MNCNDSLPVIDCSGIGGILEEVENSLRFKEFTEQLGDSLRNVGFVYFVNHGLDPALVEKVLDESSKFFTLPRDVKRKYRKLDPVENFHGYTPAEDEVLIENRSEDVRSDYKEAWDCWGPQALDDSNYPTEVPGLKGAMLEFRYRSALVPLARKILRACAAYLQLDDPDFFIKRHQAIEDPRIQSQNQARSNYYMALSPEVCTGKETMRLTEHQDWGTLTFLIQDSVGGLEAKTVDGGWVPVPPIRNSIVLNSGLMLEMWSGGHFPATAHRVRLLPEAATKVRQSLAFFLQPDGDAHCVPVVMEKEGWAPTYPKVDKETHYEYFKERVRGSRAY